MRHLMVYVAMVIALIGAANAGMLNATLVSYNGHTVVYNDSVNATDAYVDQSNDKDAYIELGHGFDGEVHVQVPDGNSIGLTDYYNSTRVLNATAMISGHKAYQYLTADTRLQGTTMVVIVDNDSSTIITVESLYQAPEDEVLDHLTIT